MEEIRDENVVSFLGENWGEERMLDWLDELKWKPILSPRGGLVQILTTWHIGKQAKLACNYFNLRILINSRDLGQCKQ